MAAEIENKSDIQINGTNKQVADKITPVLKSKVTKLGQYSPRILIEKYLLDKALREKPLIRTS